MAWYTWAIVILLIITWSQYTYPEKTSAITDPSLGKINDLINEKTPLNVGGDSSECPPTYEPVCGDDGLTYANTCLATVAGVTEITPGECDGY